MLTISFIGCEYDYYVYFKILNDCSYIYFLIYIGDILIIARNINYVCHVKILVL